MQKDNMGTSRVNIMFQLAEGSKKILDIGDINNSLLSNKLREKHDVITADIRKGADLHVNLENGLRIKGKYDTIVAGEVFEHVYKLRKLLKDINKIMTPNGRLILSVPNVCNLKSRIKVLIGRLPTYCADADDIEREIGGHVRDFNARKIKSILEETGFKIQEVKSNGLWLHNRKILPPMLCRPEWSDQIIISAKPTASRTH